MENGVNIIVDFLIILIIVAGVRMFRTPRGARYGNLTAAFALACALSAVVLRSRIFDPILVAAVLVAGSIAGYILAMRVNMIQIPAMVAFQHGAGGIAAFIVSFVELTRPPVLLTGVGRASGIIGLVVGAATFSGSMVASGKLASLIKQTPVHLPRHRWLLLFTVLLILLLGVFAFTAPEDRTEFYLLSLIVVSSALGVIFSIRIGGADMPVLISFLNATTGLAAAMCGVIIQNRLLIACGATVAASGSILTHVMCKAMNRSLPVVLAGIRKAKEGREEPSEAGTQAPVSTVEKTSVAPQEVLELEPFERAVKALRDAEKVIIIPGYGMALAQAQFAVVKLAEFLKSGGRDVKFAVHPVAGRMPGHMHVLLAEADADYDMLYEMEDVNSEFSVTDAALIVGACDVVNPAAIAAEGTPISGMPILMAHEAGAVIVCNLDDKPGYSGVANPLYDDPAAILLFGDAKDTVGRLLESLSRAG